MNIFTHELRVSIPSTLYWTISMVLLVFIFMFMYPPIAKDVRIIESVLSNFPLELRRALGITTLNLGQLLGFYGFIFIYVLLIGSIYAMKSGLAVLSEEMRTKTTDFLLTRPVSRKTVVTAKLLALLTSLIMQNAIFTILSYLILSGYQADGLDGSAFMLINLSLIQVQLFFAALGLFAAAVLKKVKTVLPLTMGVVFAFFIAQMINQSFNDAKLAYFTPFAYFDTAKIINSLSYDFVFVILNFFIAALLIVLTYWMYQRKDMPSF